MLEYIDKHTIANTISLLLDTHRGAILLVEGFDDGRLFDKFLVRHDHCRIVVALGKPNVLGVISLLRQRGHDHSVLAVVDADFWHLTGERPDDRAIITTDFHDLEMDMAMSDALEAVLREFGSADKISAFEEHSGCDVRVSLLRLLGDVGVIQYTNYRRGLFLLFRGVEIIDYVDPISLEIDVSGFLAAVLEQSHLGVSVSDVVLLVHESPSASDLPHLVRGHDLCSLLGVALRHAIGSCEPEIGAQSHVESLLRLAYGREHLERSAMYQAVTEWEDRTGLMVLE